MGHFILPHHIQEYIFGFSFIQDGVDMMKEKEKQKQKQNKQKKKTFVHFVTLFWLAQNSSTLHLKFKFR